MDEPRMIDLTVKTDERGSLAALELDRLFTPRRVFTIYDVPSDKVRGAHAHYGCSQVLICLRGSVNCQTVLQDGEAREWKLDSPERGLYLPPLTWAKQSDFTPDSILLVLASHPFDPDDYIDAND